MSASPRHRSSWLSMNYDKLVLVLVLAGLLGSVAFLFIAIDMGKREMTEARWEKAGSEPKPVTPLDMASYEEQKGLLDKPYQGGGFSNALMVSELRVACVACEKPIPFSAMTCPFCSAEQPEIKKIEDIDTDGDGLPDVVEKKFGLNPLDASDAARDGDGDGFSNIEEIQSGTDPKSGDVYPSPAAKLRLIRVTTTPFKLRFQGDAQLQDGTVRYQLNLRTLDKTYFCQIGEEIEGFTVVEYQPETPDGPALILKQGDQTLKLIKGRAIEQFELTADMVYLIDRIRLRARVGESIALKDNQYKVIDIRRDGVLIRDEKDGKTTLVTRLTDSERQELIGGAEASPQPPYGLPGAPSPRR